MQFHGNTAVSHQIRFSSISTEILQMLEVFQIGKVLYENIFRAIINPFQDIAPFLYPSKCQKTSKPDEINLKKRYIKSNPQLFVRS